MLQPARLPIFVLVSLLITLGGAGGGCGDAESAAPARQAEPVRVLATTYAMADIARAVGGKRVQTEWWVESGESLAELAENPSRRQQLNRVDLVVTRGQVDPWTLVGAGNTYLDRRILRLDVLPAAREHDPSHYIWLDPAVARELANELAVRLGALDPTHSEQFRANAETFGREIDAMTTVTEARVARTGGGPFLALDRKFYPLADRFGLSDVRIPMVNLRDPTGFNVKQLREVAEREGGGAIFASTETPVALLRDWEARLGFPVLPLDPLGTSGGAGRSTYLEILRYNLAQLEQGVARSKPRERTTTTTQPLGAVTYEPSRFEPSAAEAATLPAEAVEPVEQQPTLRTAPARPTVEHQRIRVPVTQPAPRLLPFGPGPAPAPAK